MIQEINAMCSVINGGLRMQPYVIKEITDGSGEIVEKGEPTVVTRTISEETSATMRRLLEDVVTFGGGKNSYIAGYRVGGKTGTAQVYVDGVVSSDTHIGSFLGFAPADDPRIAILVIVEEADVAVDFGSQTAAPFARDILEKSLVYMGVGPQTDETPAPEIEVPDVGGLSVEEATKTLKECGLSCVMDGFGSKVIGQLPAGGARISEGSLVMLYVDKTVSLEDNNKVKVPNVTGMSVLEANKLLRSYGLQMQIEGGGIAVSQEPAPDEEVFPTTVVRVEFESP